MEKHSRNASESWNTWVPHWDLSQAGVAADRAWIAQAIERDRPSAKEARLFLTGDLSAEARAHQRAKVELSAVEGLSWAHRAGCVLFLATLVDGRWRRAKPITRQSVVSIQNQIADALDSEPMIRAALGIVEVDHALWENQDRGWQQTAHMLVAVQSSSQDDALQLLERAFRFLKSHPEVYRRACSKLVYDLPGAIRYCFKSYSPRSTVTRSAWLDLDGKARSRKLTLRADRRAEVLNGILAVPPPCRLIAHNFQEAGDGNLRLGARTRYQTIRTAKGPAA